VATWLALVAFLALIGFAFFLLWGMPGIHRGHHEDNGPSVGGGPSSDGGGGSH
jgi:hypothetical protein